MSTFKEIKKVLLIFIRPKSLLSYLPLICMLPRLLLPLLLLFVAAGQRPSQTYWSTDIWVTISMRGPT